MSSSQKFIIANRFEINDLEKDLLGRGGMGVVYRATDNQSGETVAVKSLNIDALADEPSLLERFRREARERAAEVRAVEGRFLVNLPREKTLARGL